MKVAIYQVASNCYGTQGNAFLHTRSTHRCEQNVLANISVGEEVPGFNADLLFFIWKATPEGSAI